MLMNIENSSSMSLNYRLAVLKTIQYLNAFILKRKYSTSMDGVKITVVTPLGEEIEIYTASEAQKCKERLERMLDMERTFSKLC